MQVHPCVIPSYWISNSLCFSASGIDADTTELYGQQLPPFPARPLEIVMNSRLLILLTFLTTPYACTADERPNILFFFADDWGRYASVYADADNPSLNDVISTPNIDGVAREGVLFRNAFVPVASCGPCRASLATGRYFWNCGSGAFLNGKASNWKGHTNPFNTLPKFVDLLREDGYYVRKSQKTFAFTPSPSGPDARRVSQAEYQRYGLYVGTADDEAEKLKRHEEVLVHPRSEMRRVLAGCPEEKHNSRRRFCFRTFPVG